MIKIEKLDGKFKVILSPKSFRETDFINTTLSVSGNNVIVSNPYDSTIEDYTIDYTLVDGYYIDHILTNATFATVTQLRQFLQGWIQDSKTIEVYPTLSQTPTTNTLQNIGGTLYWEGSPISGAGSGVVATDTTLIGDGTIGNELSVATPIPPGTTVGNTLYWNQNLLSWQETDKINAGSGAGIGSDSRVGYFNNAQTGGIDAAGVWSFDNVTQKYAVDALEFTNGQFRRQFGSTLSSDYTAIATSDVQSRIDAGAGDFVSNIVVIASAITSAVNDNTIGANNSSIVGQSPTVYTIDIASPTTNSQIYQAADAIELTMPNTNIGNILIENLGSGNINLNKESGARDYGVIIEDVGGDLRSFIGTIGTAGDTGNDAFKMATHTPTTRSVTDVTHWVSVTGGGVLDNIAQTVQTSSASTAASVVTTKFENTDIVATNQVISTTTAELTNAREIVDITHAEPGVSDSQVRTDRLVNDAAAQDNTLITLTDGIYTNTITDNTYVTPTAFVNTNTNAAGDTSFVINNITTKVGSLTTGASEIENSTTVTDLLNIITSTAKIRQEILNPLLPEAVINITAETSDSGFSTAAIQMVSRPNLTNPSSWVMLSANWNNGGGAGSGSQDIYISQTDTDLMTSNDVIGNGVIIGARNSTIGVANTNTVIVGGRNLTVSNPNTVGIGGGIVLNTVQAAAVAVETTFFHLAFMQTIWWNASDTIATIELLGSSEGGRTVTIINNSVATSVTLNAGAGGNTILQTGGAAVNYTLPANTSVSFILIGTVWHATAFTNMLI